MTWQHDWYQQFCTVMNLLCSKNRPGNVFLPNKCKYLETVVTKPLFYLFSTTCVGRGSKTRAVAMSNDLAPRTALPLRRGPCTEMPAHVGTQQHNGGGQGPAQHEWVHAVLFPGVSAARSACCSFEGKCLIPKSGFGWHANPIIFHVCGGAGGDDFTSLMIAERYSSASRTFRKHICFCLACDSAKHLVDIFLWSFPIILRIYKTRTANHWQNHSFTIFWLRNNSSSLLWCFPVCVSWRRDFSTEKAVGPYPFKGMVLLLCGLSSGKHPESKVWSRYLNAFLSWYRLKAV